MPTWGTAERMDELMRRHELAGLGAFRLDESKAGRALIEAVYAEGARYVAPCRCSVVLPSLSEADRLRPVFIPASRHAAWLRGGARRDASTRPEPAPATLGDAWSFPSGGGTARRRRIASRRPRALVGERPHAA